MVFSSQRKINELKESIHYIKESISGIRDRIRSEENEECTRQVFYPEKYGAFGDGVTDDYTALQTTLNAAKNNGGIVQLSSKTYGVSANLGLTNASGVTVRGNGMGASIIKDLRADEPDAPAPGGNPTDDYYGLISFKDSSSVFIQDLTLQGACPTMSYLPTSVGGRKATFFRDCPNSHVHRVEALNFHDEAIYADNDCQGWDVWNCYVHDSNLNAINNNTATAFKGCKIIGNWCIDNGNSAILTGGSGVIISDNVCSVSGLVIFGSDLCAIDSASQAIFANNILIGMDTASSAAALSIFGSANPNSSILVIGNIFNDITGQWNVLNGGVISIAQGISAKPAGKIFIIANTISNCKGFGDSDNVAIHIKGVDSTFVGAIKNNLLVGDDTNYLRTAIKIENSTAGARIFIGKNCLSNWVTEYNVDSAVKFEESTYNSDRHLTHVGSPHTSLINDAQIGIDTTTAIATYVLPPVASSEGRNIFIYDEGRASLSNHITIEAQPGELINGIASIEIKINGAGAWCKCHGGEWKTVSI